MYIISLSQLKMCAVIAILTATMDKKSAREYPDSTGNFARPAKDYQFGIHLMEASKICVSLWPILFGAIVAQSFRMYAAWKCEATGIRLVVSKDAISNIQLTNVIAAT